MADILLVCGEGALRRELEPAVSALGHRVLWVPDVAAAKEPLGRERPALAVVAEELDDGTTEGVLGELRRQAPLMPVLAVLKARNAWRAVELIKKGVQDVVTVPWTERGLKACLSKALRARGTALELVAERPRPSPWTRLLWVAVAIGLVQLFLFLRGVERARDRSWAEPASWDLPYAHPAGLAFDGRSFWISDWFSQSLNRHEPKDGRLLRSAHFPGEVPGALAFAGRSLWTASSGQIVERLDDEKLTPLRRLADAEGPSVALAYDGLYLWTCGAKGRLAKRLLDERLSVVESYDYPGAKAAALAHDGKALWSLDAGNRELLRHELARPGAISMRVALPEYADGRFKPVGLAFDGRRFWSAAEALSGGPGRVFAHRGFPLP